MASVPAWVKWGLAALGGLAVTGLAASFALIGALHMYFGSTTVNEAPRVTFEPPPVYADSPPVRPAMIDETVGTVIWRGELPYHEECASRLQMDIVPDPGTTIICRSCGHKVKWTGECPRKQPGVPLCYRPCSFATHREYDLLAINGKKVDSFGSAPRVPAIWCGGDGTADSTGEHLGKTCPSCEGRGTVPDIWCRGDGVIDTGDM